MKPIAAILILAGVLALVFGGFSYTQDKTVAKLGPLELNAHQTKTVNVPMWGGIAAIVAGGLILVAGGRRR
jgi:3-hydroxyisobutyrate dehydrogenase-like beta-hydroxyacid dehydrogenase